MTARLDSLADFLVQVLGALADPLVLGIGLAALLLSFSALLLRAATAGAATLLGGLELWDGSMTGWDAALLAASLLGGLLAAQIILSLVAPAAVLALGAARSAMGWWRGGR